MGRKPNGGLGWKAAYPLLGADPYEADAQRLAELGQQRLVGHNRQQPLPHTFGTCCPDQVVVMKKAPQEWVLPGCSRPPGQFDQSGDVKDRQLAALLQWLGRRRGPTPLAPAAASLGKTAGSGFVDPSKCRT